MSIESHFIEMSEHRKDFRRDYVARVVVQFKTEVGAEHEIRGLLHERSKSGMGILLSNPIPAGSAVRVEHHRQSHSGVVRHCTKSDAEFHVGIELDPDSN